MASLQGIKRRIRSVKSTRQITKAMQMVEASKLRKMQAAALGPRQYTGAMRGLLARLSGSSEARMYPLFAVRPVRKALTILVAGDRGMAGGYNGNAIRALGRHIRAIGVPQQAICVGKRAAAYVARASDIEEIASYPIETGDPDVGIARPVLAEAIDLFLRGEVDVVHMVYTKFVSTVRQEVQIKQLLPVVSGGTAIESELEPGADELIDYAARRVLEADVLQAILESRASENAARMMAMMNATDNADGLISDYTLAFNNARQAGITQEIAEISGGAEAIT